MVVIADGIPLFRDALRRLILRSLSGASVIEADDADKVLTGFPEGVPSLIILGFLLCDREKAAAIRRLRQRYPGSAILVITAATQECMTESITEHGADSCVPRTAEPYIIARTINSLLRRPSVEIESAPGLDIDVPNFTTRQRQILDQLALGKTNKEIALALGISHHTVRVHISSLFKLLGVNSRTAAVAAACELRL